MIPLGAQIGAVLLLGFVLLSVAAARPRPRSRVRYQVPHGDPELRGVWLIAGGAVALVVSAVIFVAFSLNGYDGDPGPVMATVFDVAFFGGLAATLGGVLWSAVATRRGPP